jgi:hypothetical protein
MAHMIEKNHGVVAEDPANRREPSDEAPYLSHELKIAGIPSAIMEMHHEQSYFMINRGVRDAIELLVDGHPDMKQGAPYVECPGPGYFRLLDHASYLCPEVHYGVVSSVYWLNPHSKRRRLQALGSTHEKNGGSVLETRVDRMGDKIVWEPSVGSRNFELQGGRGAVVSRDVLARELKEDGSRPFILDTDLDAFSCEYFVYWKEPKDDSVVDFRRRIDDTHEFLAGLGRKPDHILITRTQGDRKWVPEGIVDEVQDYFISGLERIYYCCR